MDNAETHAILNKQDIGRKQTIQIKSRTQHRKLKIWAAGSPTKNTDVLEWSVIFLSANCMTMLYVIISLEMT
jgi:hypothetical protein